MLISYHDPVSHRDVKIESEFKLGIYLREYLTGAYYVPEGKQEAQAYRPDQRIRCLNALGDAVEKIGFRYPFQEMLKAHIIRVPELSVLKTVFAAFHQSLHMPSMMTPQHVTTLLNDGGFNEQPHVIAQAFSSSPAHLAKVSSHDVKTQAEKLVRNFQPNETRFSGTLRHEPSVELANLRTLGRAVAANTHLSEAVERGINKGIDALVSPITARLSDLDVKRLHFLANAEDMPPFIVMAIKSSVTEINGASAARQALVNAALGRQLASSGVPRQG